MDSTIDKYVEEIAAELLKASPDREKVLELAGELDSQSESEGKTRYSAARQVAERVYGLGSDSSQNTRPTAKTLASSVLALGGLGLSNEGIKDVIGKFPNIINLNEEYIEKRREYFGYTKEEFAKIVSKSINVLSNSEERIEARREYFGFTREEFAKIVSKSINVLSNSEEHIEERRKYFGYTREEFAKIVGKSPDILGHSEEYIEARREYFGFTKEEFAKIVGKFPGILGRSEEYIEARRKYFGYTREEFAKVVGKSINVLSNSEEHIEERRKYLGLDMKTFSGLVYKKPSVLSRSEDNLERRFGWYERHFGIKKEELVARLVEKPGLYFSLFDSSFYTRVLLRTKAMTANGKTLNDVRELASVLKFNEKKFVEKHGNGISIDDYIRLKDLARVTDEANPKRQKSRA